MQTDIKELQDQLDFSTSRKWLPKLAAFNAYWAILGVNFLLDAISYKLPLMLIGLWCKWKPVELNLPSSTEQSYLGKDYCLKATALKSWTFFHFSWKSLRYHSNCAAWWLTWRHWIHLCKPCQLKGYSCHLLELQSVGWTVEKNVR